MAAELVVLDGGDDDPNPLFSDVKMLDRFAPTADIAAVEQGTRRHPGGIVEEYVRVELR